MALELLRKRDTDTQGILNSINVAFAIIMKEAIDVAEVYSVPHVTGAAAKTELKPECSLNLDTCHETGTPWETTKNYMRNKAAKKLLQDEPLLPLGSIPCTNVENCHESEFGENAPWGSRGQTEASPYRP